MQVKYLMDNKVYYDVFEDIVYKWLMQRNYMPGEII